MDRIPNTNSTIQSQLFEYQIIQIIRCNSDILACQIFAQKKSQKCFPIAHSYPNIVIGNLYPKDIG